MRAWFTSNHDENSWNGTEYEKYGDFAPALAVFSATWNGVPLLYNGQELPMKTKRLEFFEKDPIPWNGKFELEDFYKTLLTLKSENPALRGGDPAVKTFWINTTANDKVLAYLRKNGDKEVLVLINTSKDAINFKLEDDHSVGSYKNVFSKAKAEFAKGSDVKLDAYGYLVFEK